MSAHRSTNNSKWCGLEPGSAPDGHPPLLLASATVVLIRVRISGVVHGGAVDVWEIDTDNEIWSVYR